MFDERHLLGLKLGNVPVEEVLFFCVTALLVAQSMVAMLPEEQPEAR